jgi:hypothetical protein
VLCCSWSHGHGGPRNLGRKLARLLVGREDSIVSLWESGKRMLGSAEDYITTDELRQAKEEVFFDGIWLLIFCIYFCFKF